MVVIPSSILDDSLREEENSNQPGGGAHVDQPGYYGQKNTIYPYRVLKFIWAFN